MIYILWRHCSLFNIPIQPYDFKMIEASSPIHNNNNQYNLTATTFSSQHTPIQCSNAMGADDTATKRCKCDDSKRRSAERFIGKINLYYYEREGIRKDFRVLNCFKWPMNFRMLAMEFHALNNF